MKSPMIDPRKYSDLIRQISQMAPGYTPEWKFSPENPDVGSALYMIAALQMEETIGLFNQVFDNQFVAFLNLMNLSILPSRPARAPLVFLPSTGSGQTVLLGAGTRVFGRSEQVPEEISFETEEQLVVHPAVLLKQIETDGAENRIVERPLTDRFTLGDTGENAQENALYIRADAAFRLTHPSVVEVRMMLDNALESLQLLADSELVQWQYETLEGWRSFSRVVVENGNLQLHKDESDRLLSEHGAQIRCVATPKHIRSVESLMLTGLEVRSRLADAEKPAKPDSLYCNGSSQTETDVYPFGSLFMVTNTVTICNEDVLSKKGARITVSFRRIFKENRRSTMGPVIDWKPVMKRSEFERMKEPRISILDVKWKYFNGFRWVNLDVGVPAERCFYTQNADETVRLSFICPEDICPIELEGVSRWGIQAEVVRVENEYLPNGIFMSPIISEVAMDYNYPFPLLPDRIFSRNNMETEDLYTVLANHERTVPAFRGTDREGKSLYLMLDALYDSGPLNLLFLLDQNMDRVDQANIGVSIGEVRNRALEWSEIPYDDDTGGLIRSGVLKLFLDRKYLPVRLFNQTGVWVRIRIQASEGPWRPRTIRQILLNGVWSRQVYTLESEVLDYKPDKHTYLLTRAPIRDVEVLVDEMGALSQVQAEELLKGGLESTCVRNDYGLIDELWVRWLPVETLINSTHEDRVFVPDLIQGEIAFGEGKHGLRLPPGNGRHVRVRYRTTQGKAGNIEALKIKQMEISRAYIDSVYNPIRAEGGNDFEPPSTARKRGLMKIRSRGIPVSAEDFERVIQSEFPVVYRVRCCPNTNREMQYSPGSLLIAAAPEDNPESGLDDGTWNTIFEFLAERLPAALPKTKLVLVNPAMIQVSVQVKVRLLSDGAPQEVRQVIESRLAQFLDYRIGGLRGVGFQLGEFPDENSFYTLFREIPGMSHVEKLSLSWVRIENGLQTELASEDAKKVLNGIVRNGEHQIEFGR